MSEASTAVFATATFLAFSSVIFEPQYGHVLVFWFIFANE